MAELSNHNYVPVRSKDILINEDQAETPTAFRRTNAYSIGTLVLVGSIILNFILLFYFHAEAAIQDLGMSSFSRSTFDTLVPYHSYTRYWNPSVNQSEADEAWDTLDTDPVAIALSDDFARVRGLSSSTRFPWDTERSVYYIKGYHDLHCLKLIRKYVVAQQNGEYAPISLGHIFHCLDGLRQDIMCIADDTPMPAAREHFIGDGQVRRCRDWSKLEKWAKQPEQHACYRFDDYRIANSALELFGYCREDSPYFSVMRSYFEIHGHKEAYGKKSLEEPFLS